MQAMDFPYDNKVVSQKQFDTHIGLYHNAVDAANRIESALGPQLWPGANTIDSPYRALRKEQAYAMNAVVLHEAYFKNMSHEQGKPGDSTMRLIQEGFGSLENWHADFIACAKSARGWCITTYNQRMGKVTNNLLDAHDVGFMALAFPLVVLDMYEHAYFMDDGSDKAAYINRFVEGIDWDVVEARAWAVTYALDN